MRLYEFGPTRSIRVRWTLQELGIPFESVTVDLTKGEHLMPEFLALNPGAKLPVLVDGELTLTESVAIVLYLADKYPDKGLAPTSLAGRAELYRWLLFTATELEQPLWRIARHTNIYPREKRIRQDIELAREDFTDVVRVLDQHMQGREFVVGESVTVADFVLAYTLDWANAINLLDGFPQIVSYMEKMYSRPAAPLRVREALARERR